MVSILEKAAWIFRKKKVVHENLDTSQVKEGVINAHLAAENAELKGYKARREAEDGAKRESEKDQAEEDEVKLILDQRSKEIQKKSQVRFFSLKLFFHNLAKNKQFRDKLRIMTWDRKTVISKFSDLGISQDGEFVVLGEGNEIILKMRNLKDIFQSVSAIENDFMNGIIPVNLDSEGGYIENIQIIDMPEIVPDGDGNFHYAKARKKPLYEHIQELNNQISELQTELENAESTNVGMQAQLDEANRVNRVLLKTAQVAKANVSKNEQQYISMNSIFNDTLKEMMSQRTYNLNLEETKESLDQVVEVLREKAEREGSKLSDEKALENFTRLRDEIQSHMIDKLAIDASKPETKQVEIVNRPPQSQGGVDTG